MDFHNKVNLKVKLPELNWNDNKSDEFTGSGRFLKFKSLLV